MVILSPSFDKKILFSSFNCSSRSFSCFGSEKIRLYSGLFWMLFFNSSTVMMLLLLLLWLMIWNRRLDFC